VTRATNNHLSAAPLTPLREVDAIASKIGSCGYVSRQKRASGISFCWVTATKLRKNVKYCGFTRITLSQHYNSVNRDNSYTLKENEPEINIPGSHL
jgi:hypothetical protein